VFEIIDKERRQIVAEFETREEAEARLAELVEAEPEAEGLLIITSTGEAPR
jgi:hypothetical protein